MSDPFIGIIVPWPNPTKAPQGWMLCQGQQLSIQNYPALYSIIGTLYGGDGVKTFALPDLRGRMAVCAVNSSATPTNFRPHAGNTGGSSVTKLAPSQVPAHTHAGAVSGGPATGSVASATLSNAQLVNGALSNAFLQAANAAATSANPSPVAPSTMMSVGIAGSKIYGAPGTATAPLGPVTGNVTATVSGNANGTVTISGGSTMSNAVGNSQAISIMPQYVVMNYMIAVEGLYPSLQ